MAKSHDHKFAVFFMDLDNFKIINDTMGHEAGDELLKEVALRLAGTGRKMDTVARLGGDEFAFIINKVNGIEDAVSFARRLNKLLKTPITVNGHNINMGSSIGVTLVLMMLIIVRSYFEMPILPCIRRRIMVVIPPASLLVR